MFKNENKLELGAVGTVCAALIIVGLLFNVALLVFDAICVALLALSLPYWNQDEVGERNQLAIAIAVLSVLGVVVCSVFGVIALLDKLPKL